MSEEEPNGLFERLPGPVKLLIVDVGAAAVLIAAGLPAGWAVAALTVGDIAILYMWQRKNNDEEK